MYKNRNADGSANISGGKIRKLRCALSPYVSQRKLADMLQLIGLDLDKNAVQRIEQGKRFVTDVEVVGFARVFNITVDELLKDNLEK